MVVNFDRLVHFLRYYILRYIIYDISWFIHLTKILIVFLKGDQTFSLVGDIEIVASHMLKFFGDL